LDQYASSQDGSRSDKPSRPIYYEIRVEGQLDTSWSEWFDGLQVIPQESGETLIAGFIQDQADLQGLFTKVFNLRLPLVSVRRIQQGS
jgi:hypothetical protein